MTWDGLLTKLLARVKRRNPTLRLDGWKDLHVADKAQLLDNALPRGVHGPVTRLIQSAARPSLVHVLLASLDCTAVVTTNYDQLFERAHRAAFDGPEGSDPSLRSIPWNRADDVDAERPWILKMHGDVRDPKSIVLTRRDFVEYDSLSRPAGSVLESLLLTKHLLLVGASLSDDNVIRLAHEVHRFRQRFRATGLLGTFLDGDGLGAKQELWSSSLDWVDISDADDAERGRTLQLVLDVVAAHGCRNASWCLDPRFEHLLTDEEKSIAEQARQVHARLAGVSEGPLVSMSASLEALGAPPRHR